MSSESSTRSPSFHTRSMLAQVPGVSITSAGLPLTVTLVLLPAHVGTRWAIVKRSGCESATCMLTSELEGYWVCWVSETRALPWRHVTRDGTYRLTLMPCALRRYELIP